MSDLRLFQHPRSLWCAIRLSYTLCSGCKRVHMPTSNPTLNQCRFPSHSLSLFSSRQSAQPISTAQALIMIGLSDVWSAIRNISAAQLGHLIDALSLEHGQSLAMACAQVRVIPKLLYFPRITILTVAQVCTDSSATWQAKEGALQGEYMISHSFMNTTRSFPPNRYARGCAAVPVGGPWSKE
jgi:hypothetical protein